VARKVNSRELRSDLGALPVTAVMTGNVLTVHPHDRVVEVWQGMQNLGTRLAVVVDGTRVVAVVSERVLALRWPGGGPVEMRSRRVSDVVEIDTPVLRPDATVQEAAELIADLDVEAVPVVDTSKRLVGLVTPAELVRLIARPPRSDENDA
jgi:CBS domain-containing protein